MNRPSQGSEKDSHGMIYFWLFLSKNRHQGKCMHYRFLVHRKQTQLDGHLAFDLKPLNFCMVESGYSLLFWPR
jgi:hypothetical protein